MTLPPSDVAAVVSLTKELTDLRRRGLDDVDLLVDDMSPLPPMLLEELARRYLGERAPHNRPDLLRQYLKETLALYSSAHGEPEAAFIRRLFFTEDEDVLERPKELRDAAIIKTRLSDETFRKRSRAHFKQFAVFLLGLDAGAKSVTDEAVVGDEPAAAQQPGGIAPSQPSRAIRWLSAALAGALVIALVVIAVLIMELRQRPSAESTPETPASTSPTSPALTPTDATLTFDDLGGGSSVIRVFHGVGDSLEDKTPTGTFSHGDTVRTICKKEGREVVSETSVGEKPRKSSTWIRIEGTPGVIQFARLTYARMSKEDLASLPICP